MASHMEVAHRWATRWEVNGRKLSGLRGFNMWSDGDSIFSYGRHFEIARYVDAPKAGRVVLFTRRDHSISTSKHKTYTRRAIPSFVPVFHVFSFDASVKENLKAYEADAAENFEKAQRARVYGDSLLERGNAALDEAERYAQAFGVKYRRPDLSAVVEIIRKRNAVNAKAAAKARKERERLDAIRRAEERIADLAAFEAWQSGEGWRVPRSYQSDADGNAYVRRSADGETLETSQGASVPWAHAVKAFRFVKLCRERGEGWRTNGRVVRVGHYQVAEITDTGDMIAGCHRFAWQAMEALAIAQGVFDAPASAEAVEAREQ